jgi:xanthine/CO dehydrogenase XdhC/CoxF family maturation factor
MKQELAAMIALAERLVASDAPGTLSTLFSARGSTYRPLGAMMVSLPGMHAGGVTGGCLEEYVARAGERATRNTSAAMLRFSTDPDSDDDNPVLGCGGSIDLLVERLTSDHVRLLAQLAGASERDEYSLLACVVKRTGQSLSVAREWLRPAEGSCDVMPELARICGEATRDGRSHHAILDSDTAVPCSTSHR